MHQNLIMTKYIYIHKLLYNEKSALVSAHLASATTPATSLALLLDMHDDIHVPAL
jgi:hypothetical protein